MAKKRASDISSVVKNASKWAQEDREAKSRSNIAARKSKIASSVPSRMKARFGQGSSYSKTSTSAPSMLRKRLVASKKKKGDDDSATSYGWRR